MGTLMMSSISSASDPALHALFVPFANADLRFPASARVLFLGARDGFGLREMAQSGWVCQQSFKPFADALQRSGLQVLEPDADDRFELVLLLPPRQRDPARALFAQAVRHLAPGGTIVASMTNNQGARTGQADLQRLIGPVCSVSKYKCRVFWGYPDDTATDAALLREWSALDAPRRVADGRYLSRPGLFAWDRIDPASALLAAHLPVTLSGRVADLGAGYGYLSAQVLERCSAVTAIDLFEAERRALDIAKINLDDVQARFGRPVAIDVIWHDVAMGLPRNDYDVIVSNPPFHQGRADLPQLGQAFIKAAADALRSSGSLWLVANRHLPYEATLVAHFGEVRKVAEQDGFKVIEARRPCQYG